MAARRSYCAVDRSWYRGSWATHAGTAKHRAAIARAELKSYDVGRKHAGRRSAALLHSRQDYADSRMVDVDAYYRNPPTPPWPASIRDRVWYVVRHWRRPPGSVKGSSRVQVGKHRRKRRRRA